MCARRRWWSKRSSAPRASSLGRFGGLDFDNDGAFMNDIVVPWCRSRDIEVTRSRAYKKNDQAFVEQKNGAIVRRLVGYGRLEGIEAARTLARLFAAARLHINFFQPSFKLKEKRREGASMRSQWDVFTRRDPSSPRGWRGGSMMRYGHGKHIL